ncbi:kinase-like protein [Clavulina sp. PMI_390]|nr:kinase-like protein [Clavulina sp. PMI_390]
MHHENILPFLGVYHEDADSPPLTIVPFIEGGSLCNFLAGGKQAMDLKFLQRLVIEYLHSRVPQVIHGDLHPGNVLLDEKGHPYLCDFGLSRIRHEVTRTRTKQQAGGMARFLAPELTDTMFDKFRTTWQSDVHSLAMLSLNMWTGERPFSHIDLEWRVCEALVKGERPKRPGDTSRRVDLPRLAGDAFWKLLVEMWAQKPTERPTSLAVLKSIKKVLGEAPLDAAAGVDGTNNVVETESSLRKILKIFRSSTSRRMKS